MATITQPSATNAPDTKANFKASVGAKPIAGKKPRSNPFQRLSESQVRWIKMLGYGHSGTGKSYAIKGFLEAGLKVLVISTDFGGSGLNTVINELVRDGKAHLLENIYNADFATYDEVEEFLQNPQSVFPDIYDLDIDMLIWDGFSGFQQNHVTTKVADMIPTRQGGGSVSEQRESGLQIELQDWGMVRNGTLRPLMWFLGLHNKVTGKQWHKYVTALEANKEDKLQNEKMTGPLLQGSARDLIGPMFDVIFQAKSKVSGAGEDKKREYFYNCVGHERLLAKSRGFQLDNVERGDMKNVWTKIAKQLGSVQSSAPEAPAPTST